MKKRPGQKLDIIVTCVQLILILAEIFIFLMATFISFLTILLPCKPPFLSSHFWKVDDHPSPGQFASFSPRSN